MSSVKRYDLEYTNEYSTAKKMVVRENGDWIEATDYDRLVEVCRELLGNIDCTHVTLGKRRRELKAKALALLGEKEN